MQNEDNLHVVVYWIECCLILHNMIIVFEENHQMWGEQVESVRWAREEAAVHGDDADPAVGLEQPRETEGQQFQSYLAEKLFDQCGIQF